VGDAEVLLQRLRFRHQRFETADVVQGHGPDARDGGDQLEMQPIERRLRIRCHQVQHTGERVVIEDGNRQGTADARTGNARDRARLMISDRCIGEDGFASRDDEGQERVARR
jgi:hypothetical protein